MPELDPVRVASQRITAAIGLLGFAVITLTCQRPALAQDRFSDADARAVQTFLRDAFTNDYSGMVVGLLDTDRSRVFGAGKPMKGVDQEVNGDTLFEIGSVTKVFTVLLALDMERRGEINLGDPVSKYLPARVKVPAYDGHSITFRNLASQDSGLPWNPDRLDKILNQDPKKPALREFKLATDAYTAEDLYDFLSGYTLTNAPGTRFQYSNVGMALLGQAMALKAGESYESLVVNRICRPLQMVDTCITLTPEQKARLARGHMTDGTPGENIDFKVMASAGSLLSTVNDLLKFLAAHLGFTRTDLTPLTQAMQLPRHTGDARFGKTAMPWVDDRVYQPVGSELMGHGGGGFGYIAFIGLDTKKRRGVVVLSNQMVVNPPGVGWALLQGMPLSPENVAYLVREIVGIGIALETDSSSGLLRITKVYSKSPAGQAGLSAGHLIRTINGTRVEGKSVQECLALIGGPAGGRVRLEIAGQDGKATNLVELARQKFITSTL